MKEDEGEMQLGLTILSLILACVAIWLGLRNKKSTESNKKSTDKSLKDIEEKVRAIPHIRKMVGGKHKK